MHVAHLLDSLEIGGAQKLLVLFAEEAKARGIKVTIISLSTIGRSDAIVAELESFGARVEFLTIYKLYDPTALPRLLMVLRKEKIDVIQTHLGHSNVLGVMAGVLINTPVVATMHSTHVSQVGRFFHLRFLLELYCLRFGARRVIAVGKKVEEVYRDRLTPKTIVDVVPNPVKRNPILPQAERDISRKEFVEGGDRFLVLSVGRLTPEKGLNDLLIAFSQVRKKHPSAMLIVVGDGEVMDELKSLAASLDLGDDVRFTGSRNDVPRLMSVSDMYVSSSYREGLSLAMLEAMAAGLPILATRVGDTELLLNDGRGQMIMPQDVPALRDGICYLIENDKERRKISSAARTFVETNFSPDTWMERLINIYGQVQSDER